jgi:hypothetical protein
MGKLIKTFGVSVNVVPIISRFSVTVAVSLFAGLDVFFIKPEETQKHRILVFFMEKQAGILVLKLAWVECFDAAPGHGVVWCGWKLAGAADGLGGLHGLGAVDEAVQLRAAEGDDGQPGDDGDDEEGG